MALFQEPGPSIFVGPCRSSIKSIVSPVKMIVRSLTGSGLRRDLAGLGREINKLPDRFAGKFILRTSGIVISGSCCKRPRAPLSGLISEVYFLRMLLNLESVPRCQRLPHSDECLLWKRPASLPQNRPQIGDFPMFRAIQAGRSSRQLSSVTIFQAVHPQIVRMHACLSPFKCRIAHQSRPAS
jgi:hypothetical protein